MYCIVYVYCTLPDTLGLWSILYLYNNSWIVQDLWKCGVVLYKTLVADPLNLVSCLRLLWIRFVCPVHPVDARELLPWRDVLAVQQRLGKWHEHHSEHHTASPSSLPSYSAFWCHYFLTEVTHSHLLSRKYKRKHDSSDYTTFIHHSMV